MKIKAWKKKKNIKNKVRENMKESGKKNSNLKLFFNFFYSEFLKIKSWIINKN
jgi:hypothetical protein